MVGKNLKIHNLQWNPEVRKIVGVGGNKKSLTMERKAVFGSRGVFLERSGNFSGPESRFIFPCLHLKSTF